MPYKNKADQAAAARRHYEANTDKVKATARAFTTVTRSRNRDFVYNYKLTHPCVDCGNSNPIVLDFDHLGIEPKLFSIAGMMKGHSIPEIIKEIAKCEVVCSNCHRIRTHKRRMGLSLN